MQAQLAFYSKPQPCHATSSGYTQCAVTCAPADLASEMLVTQWLVGQLKQQPDVPVVPGAVSPPLPLLIQPPALYFDNSTAGEHTAGGWWVVGGC